MPEVILHRLIAPLDPDPSVAPLYAEPHEPAGIADVKGVGRGSFEIGAGASVSFGTYFNAFPAAYWARWTSINDVRLNIRAEGSGTIRVYRSDSTGRAVCVATLSVVAHTDVAIDLALVGMTDGGWFWFDAWAGDTALRLVSAQYVAASDVAPGAATVAITTFNRPDYCLALLGTLASRLEDLDCVEQIVVVDQGTSKVTTHAGFTDVEQAFAGRLRVVDQPNYGGSGGFARGMLEALASERSRYVQLLDDDIVLEPESIVRAVRFAEHCLQPTIVGGHMLSMSERSSLHSFGEDIDLRSFWWGPAPGVAPDHDFAEASLRDTPWMHRRVDVGYNGWWMCLIPTSVLCAIGMAQPFFIKWDDAEYGLRASEAGIPTVTLPGAAVWHVPWTDKDDALDWQAYFHQRNRVVAALLHSDRGHGGGLVLEGLVQQVVHILAMQYSTAALRLKAVTDIEEGPRHLHPGLRRGLSGLNRLRSTFSDGERVGVVPDAVSLGLPRRLADLASVEQPSKVWLLRQGLRALVHQASPASESSRRRPDVSLDAGQARWWLLAQLDSARVETREGTGTIWYRRDRQLASALLRRSVRAYLALWQRWPELARTYRRDSGSVTSPTTWGQALGVHSELAGAGGGARA